jgi:CheY-like chemotaxis protein
VVDDENALRNIAAAALVRYGYKTLQATDGAEALTAFALNQDLVKAVVVDMNMPMMDGATTIMALRRLRPSLPVVAMSGLPEQEIAARKASPDHLLFLQKPFAADELLRAVDEALRPTPPPPAPR